MSLGIKNNLSDGENKNSKIDHNMIINIKSIGTDYSYKHEIVWKNAIGFLILHILALWGLGILLTGGLSFKGFLWGK